MPSLQNFALGLFLITNIILGICTSIDLPIHYLRGLGLWEKVSHPIDAFCITLSMFLGFKAITLHSTSLFWAYCIVAVITVVLTYKDEFIHQQECPPFEQVVHAVMFTCIGVSLSIGAVLILLKTGASFFFLGFVVGSIFFLAQIVLNYFTKPPNHKAQSYE